jgi:mannose-6-phosphate isomerase-like protein (cupin superfamily)
MIDAVNLEQALGGFDEHWAPRIVARVDDYELKVVKVAGPFVWHHHDDADELFHVLRGRLTMAFRDQPAVELGPGDVIVVPRGVEHCPSAEEGTEVAVFERAGVVNTGSAGGDRTRAARPI